MSKLIKTYLVDVITETNFDDSSLFTKGTGVHAKVKSEGTYFSNKRKALKFYNSVKCSEVNHYGYSEKKSKVMYELDPSVGVYHEIK